MSTMTHAPLASGDVAVYIDNRRVGTVANFGIGFAYVPAGQRRGHHGEILPSVTAVLKTLEES